MSNPTTGKPLPIGYHFHSRYEQFRGQLFRDGANYVGHELMVPEPGDYRVLETTDDQYILLRAENGECVLISNICRHQQARLIDPKNRPERDSREGNLSARSSSGRIVCPVHAWSYRPSGELHLAPLFKEQPKTCLPKMRLQSWNGMLFHSERDINADMSQIGHSGLFDPKLLNMKDYVFMGTDEPTHYDFSWEQFITVYFDLYHVAPYHPSTFAQIVDCQNLAWEFGERYSMQIAGWKTRSPNVSIEKEGYGKVWVAIDRKHREEKPAHGALWLTMYPGVMVEWYPHVLVVSTLRQTGVGTCVNHVEYYVHKDWHHPNQKNRAQDIYEDAQKAYLLSAREDGEICQSMQDSYQNMWDSGEHFVGPRHQHLETGIDRFFDYVHEEWKRKNGAHSEIVDVKKYE
jgi:choline monooxygenase